MVAIYFKNLFIYFFNINIWLSVRSFIAKRKKHDDLVFEICRQLSDSVSQEISSQHRPSSVIKRSSFQLIYHKDNVVKNSTTSLLFNTIKVVVIRRRQNYERLKIKF